MGQRYTGNFKIADWDESAYLEHDDGRKLSQASVEQTFSGDIEGEGSVRWLMCYRRDKTAEFVGLQRIDGRLGERSGSFVLLQTDGSFDGSVARGRLSIVPGSGTGDLDGLRGQGEFSAPQGGQASLTLECDFE